VSFNTTRAVSFRVRAATAAASLQWRRAGTSTDVFTPASGSIYPAGTSDVAVTQTVLDHNVTIEIVDGSSVLLSFTLANY
jgi:hypothetical protein